MRLNNLQFYSHLLRYICIQTPHSDYDVYDDLVLSNIMFAYLSVCLLFAQQIFQKWIDQFKLILDTGISQ